MAWCTNCGDEFEPIAAIRRLAGAIEDPDDQSNFCSDSCYESWQDAIDAEAAYREAGYGSPVWP